MKTIRNVIVLMLLVTIPPFVQEAKSEEKELTGVVKDQDSQPVTGAHIHLYTLNGAFSYEADTDGNGRYALKIEDCGQKYKAVVSAKGYSTYETCNYTRDITSFVSLEGEYPTRDFTLYGKLSYKNGQQATIMLPVAPDPSLGKYYRLDRRGVGSDEEARKIYFKREPSPQADIPYILFPERDFELDMGDYDLSREPGSIVVPIPEEVQKSFPPDYYQCYVAMYGSYKNQGVEFSRLTDGEIYQFLDVTQDCYADGPYYGQIGACRAYMRLLSPYPYELELVFEDPGEGNDVAAQLSGKVTNQDGEPIAGAGIRVYNLNEAGGTEVEYTAETDDEGRYTLDIGQTNRSYYLTASATGYSDYLLDLPFIPGSNTLSFITPIGDIVMFNRLDFKADRQATIVLPQNPDPSWGRYYRLERYEKCDDYSNVVFVREYSPKANVPYVIFPNQDFSISLSDYDLNHLSEPEPVLVSAEDSYPQWGLYGTYHSRFALDFSAPQHTHLLDSTPDCTKGSTKAPDVYPISRVGAFRAYLLAFEPKFVFVDETTAIESVASETDKTSASEIYDLQGRRCNSKIIISNYKKGIYIQNGRKVVR